MSFTFLGLGPIFLHRSCSHFFNFSRMNSPSCSIDIFGNKNDDIIALPPKFLNIVRAAFALYLVIFLTAGDAGYWLFAVINQRTIKNEISEVIREQCVQRHLLELTFANNSSPKKECIWTEEGKEFLFRNEMYDVVASIIKKDSTTYRCFKDEKETDFRFLVNGHAIDDDVSTPSIRFFDPKIVKDYTGHDITDRFYSSAEQYSLPFVLLYQSPTSDLCTPPPKFS